MFKIDQIILLASVLILLGIVSSKASARLGVPVLVMFLGVGMLAGEGGIGGIIFDDAIAAHALGSLALAFILYDGGLQTPASSIRMIWKPAAFLASFGVLITALVTGAAAAWTLNRPLLEGMLLGAIVGSTDAAAVFAQLRNAGLHIRARIKSLLEVESASNDPMAIFLTIGVLEMLVNKMPFGVELLKLFFMQMGLGAVVGLGVGKLAVWLINRIQLNAAGLYIVAVAAIGLFSFGVAANIGGSGFLAIYLTGIVIGNSRFVFQQGSFLFMDGLAWMSQITMFVVLGLLSNPDELIKVWREGLAIAAVLVLIARPLAVMPFLLLFKFSFRETAFVSWVGLRGSVPIILAIFPMVFGLPGAALIFNVVFFVVLISAVVQGGTMPMLAKWLGLAEPAPAAAAAALEITSMGNIDTDIVEYTLGSDSRANNRRISRLALPEGVLVAMLTRGDEVVPPRGSTLLKTGDHLFVMQRPNARHYVERAFSRLSESVEMLPAGKLRLKGSTTVGDLFDSYDIHLDADENITLEHLLQNELPKADEYSVGQSIQLNGLTIAIVEMVGSRIATVCLSAIATQLNKEP